MFMQNFMEPSAAVHALWCWQRKELSNDAKSTTAVASTGSNKQKQQVLMLKKDKWNP